MSKIYKEFPVPLKIQKLLGPSFIILALGLGSGEVILWPYLVSNYGLGIAWGAILGITFQFFINMEIERYALIKGESVFVGLAKIFTWTPYWFILSTFIGFGLPGIIAASAEVCASLFGITNFKWIAIGMLILIGIVLSAGKTIYHTMERVTKTIILIGVPFIFTLTIILSSKMDWAQLASGIMGRGIDFHFLPKGIALATFFAAFAYSGAGGNLNLTQSIYIKEKGYGMGKYAEKIAGFFTTRGKMKHIKLSGEKFELNQQNISRFKQWWNAINFEHGLIFLFVGGISMLLLMLLSFTTTFGLHDNIEGIHFVINEGAVIGKTLLPSIGVLFLLVVSIMLFQTQLGILDSTSRIMAENIAIKKLSKNPNGKIHLSQIYSFFVWIQITFGITLFLLNIYEPKTLIILGAVINAVAMFIHVGLVSWLNQKSLPKKLQPKLWRKIILLIIFLFFGFFSILILLDKLKIIT